MRAGERLSFSLEHYLSHLPQPKPADVEAQLARTEKYWRDWTSRCTYKGRWRDAVIRSLITLKALTQEPTGGIVAAPTTSLPEELSGVRNWDYRFCWVRDSTLTLDALMRSGYLDEAAAWRDWLMRASAGAPAQLQIMYGVGGEHRLTEVELPWLPGYEESRPVRIGNGAYDQFQLDAYGQVIHTLYDALSRGLPHHPGEADQILTLVDFVEQNWQRTDEGIWEVRGPNARHFTHSKVMAWVAVDRAIRLYEEFKVGANHTMETRMQRWRALREEIRNDILARAFNRRLNAFVQYYDSEDLDASVLLIPHTGFLRGRRSAHAVHGRGDRERAHLGRARPALRDGERQGRAARSRSHVPHLQLLARRQLRDVGSARRRGGAARSPRLALELAGAPGGGVSPRAAPSARQLPASVFAHRAHQHRSHHRRGTSRAHGRDHALGYMDPTHSVFAVLTLIAAPAVLTNATSVLGLNTANRFGRAVDRSRTLETELSKLPHDSALAKLRRAQLERLYERAEFLLRAQASIYFALGLFVVTALVAVVGGVLVTAFPSWRRRIRDSRPARGRHCHREPALRVSL